MKTIVIFYDNNSSYSKEKAFDGKSALELSKNWAESLGLPAFTVKSASLSQLLCDMKELCSKEGAETAGPNGAGEPGLSSYGGRRLQTDPSRQA